MSRTFIVLGDQPRHDGGVQGIAPDTDHRAGRIAALACAHDRTDDGPVRRLSSRHPVERPALLVQAQPPTAPASA